MSKLITLIALGFAVVGCAAATPTSKPATPSLARQTPSTAPTSSPTPAVSSSALSGTYITGTVIFVGDTISPIAFDGVNCLGVGNYAGIHKGSHLEFHDAADTSAQPALIGDAVLDPGTPAGQDCKFTWSGYLGPGAHYVAALGKMHSWQLDAPVVSPLYLTFKASEVGASASP